MLDVGSAHGRGSLGAQRERAATRVSERVHLLLNDVRDLTHGPDEQLRGLKGRGFDPLVPRGAQNAPGLGFQRIAPGSVLSEHVHGAARGLYGFAQGREVSSRRKGLVARSRPSVVIPMWPGYTVASGEKDSISVSIELSSVGQSPPCKSTLPTEPWKSTSPEKRASSEATA